ncbi:MAG: baseplate J/gp47 family protein, partial [Prolixibacteraceae bacterium]
WQAFGDSSWAKAKVGFALASPVLLLKEGSRSILVNLSLGGGEGTSLPAASALSKCLNCSLTGEKDWIGVPATVSIKGRVLSLVIELAPSVPPVTPYHRPVHKGKYTTADPVLRILIDTALQGAFSVYDALRKLTLLKAEIQVNVSGAKELLLENDHGKLDPSKVFFPFGPTPGAGSHCYIGYPELFEKNWSNISLDLSWKDKPGDLSAHYAAYLKKFIDQNSNDYQVTGEESVSERKIGGDDHFTVKLQYLQDNSWYPASGDVAGQELFSVPLELKPDAAGQPDRRKKTAHDFGKKEQAFTVSTRSGYMRMTLEQSFLHEYFAHLYALAAIARINHPEYILPLQPWMPAASSLSLAYSASEVRGFDQADPAAGAVSLFYEEPFGQHEAAVSLKKDLHSGYLTGGKAPGLVPDFSPEGEFYIGLDRAKAYDTVNLLFQVAEGSENPLAPTFGKDKKIAWSLLVSNKWKTLTGDWILADGTANLLRSGIIRLIIPPGADPENTLFAEDLIWIRACLPEGLSHSSVCRLISLDAQAAEAVFTGSESEGRLPAGTISSMAGKPALIKKINQPYASFGGKAAEDSRAFYLRVSERLRHKQRAITIWDYERLVLQEFPAVYKLKCLSHSAPVDGKGNPASSGRSPGDVSLVVVPDIRLRTSFDPLKPRASQGLLAQISSFVSALHSLHVRFHVMNPLYETVKLDFRVKFYDQFDPNTYVKKLNEDLIRYLSPWAFGDFSGMHFGGTVYKSVMIRFLETRPYVDFVSRVRMIHRLDENDLNTNDLQIISASSAKTILVSAPEHSIQLINKELVCHE